MNSKLQASDVAYINPSALRVGLEESDGTAIPIDKLVPRLLGYLKATGKTCKLNIEVVYKDEDDTYQRLDYKTIQSHVGLERIKARLMELELLDQAVKRGMNIKKFERYRLEKLLADLHDTPAS